MAETLVEINWTRLGSREEVEDLVGENDYGLYQITGHHPVFGDDSLLYIGMAQEQSFAQRLDQHKKWLGGEWDLTVYVGRMDIDNKLWEAVIEDAEALLIYFHAPPYNAKSISDKPAPKTPLRIINSGDCGSLSPEISHKGLDLYDKHPRDLEE